MIASVAIVGWGRIGPLGTAATVDLDLDGLPGPAQARAARAERMSQLAMIAAGRALADAGIGVAQDPRPDAGIVLGTALGCFLTNVAYAHRLRTGGVAAASPRLFAATVSNAAAGEVSIAYGLGGPAITVTAGTAAGTIAFDHAVELLHAEMAGVVLAGGVDAGGAAVTRFVDASGFGTPWPSGEGAAMALLEPVEAARRHGRAVFATIVAARSGHARGSSAGDGLAGLVDATLTAGRAQVEDIGETVIIVRGAMATPEAQGEIATRLGRVLAGTICWPAEGDALGATGIAALEGLARRCRRGALGLLVDACPSGHMGTVLVRGGGDA